MKVEGDTLKDGDGGYRESMSNDDDCSHKEVRLEPMNVQARCLIWVLYYFGLALSCLSHVPQLGLFVLWKRKPHRLIGALVSALTPLPASLAPPCMTLQHARATNASRPSTLTEHLQLSSIDINMPRYHFECVHKPLITRCARLNTRELQTMSLTT